MTGRYVHQYLSLNNLIVLYGVLYRVAYDENFRNLLIILWLPCMDSNHDKLIQSQPSYH
jgi:hypothetical protein